MGSCSFSVDGGLEASSWPPNWSLPFWVGPGTSQLWRPGQIWVQQPSLTLYFPTAYWYSVSLICDLPLERDFKWKWGKRKLLTLSSRANKSDSRKCCVLCGWVELTLWHWTTEKLTHTHTHYRTISTHSELESQTRVLPLGFFKASLDHSQLIQRVSASYERLL